MKAILTIFFILTMLVTMVLHGCSPGGTGENMTDRTAAMHQKDQPVATAAATTAPKVPVTTKSIQYATVNGQRVTGYFAQPKEVTAPLPGLITIHEWWGLNENIEAMTRRLAGEGYQVLAVDLYNRQTAQSPENAHQLVQEVTKNQEAAKENLAQAFDYLVQQQNASEVGVIGWCFGGGWSLQTALLLPNQIDAAVIYYGQLVSDPDKLKSLQMPILGIFGAQDQSIPIADVRQFERTLKSLDKEVEVQIYENAGHAFANPSGDRYVPDAAAAAWEKTTQFLRAYLT